VRYVHKNTTFQIPHTPDKKIAVAKKNAVENICTRKKQKYSRLPAKFFFLAKLITLRLPVFTTPSSSTRPHHKHLPIKPLTLLMERAAAVAPTKITRRKRKKGQANASGQGKTLPMLHRK
jgi:hypothetical protein